MKSIEKRKTYVTRGERKKRKEEEERKAKNNRRGRELEERSMGAQVPHRGGCRKICWLKAVPAKEGGRRPRDSVRGEGKEKKESQAQGHESVLVERKQKGVIRGVTALCKKRRRGIGKKGLSNL